MSTKANICVGTHWRTQGANYICCHNDGDFVTVGMMLHEYVQSVLKDYKGIGEGILESLHELILGRILTDALQQGYAYLYPGRHPESVNEFKFDLDTLQFSWPKMTKKYVYLGGTCDAAAMRVFLEGVMADVFGPKIKAEKIGDEKHYEVTVGESVLLVIHRYNYNTDSSEWVVEVTSSNLTTAAEFAPLKEQAIKVVKENYGENN